MTSNGSSSSVGEDTELRRCCLFVDKVLLIVPNDGYPQCPLAYDRVMIALHNSD